MPPPLVVAHLGTPFRVGVVRWSQYGSTRLTLIAKLTVAVDRPELSAEQLPLLGRDAPPGGPNAPFDPGDFIPAKAGADLLLVGSARVPSGSLRHAGFIAMNAARPLRAWGEGPSWRRDLSFGSDGRSTQVPLGSSQVFEADAVTPAGPLGRIPPRPGLPGRSANHDDDFDFKLYQCAPLAQQLDVLTPGALIELGGALAQAPGRVLRVPSAPRLLVDRGFGKGEVAQLVCDTLTLDLDAGTMVGVWRCDIPLEDGDRVDIDRIIARWSPGDGEGNGEGDADPEALRREVPRATFVLAEQPGRAAEPEDADRIRGATFEAMEIGAAPSLDVRTYATISATLVEGRAPRRDVLAQHGLTEEHWTVEDRAQGEAMARGASRGDVEHAVAFGEAFVAAQDALAQPSEASWTVEQHAHLTASLEVTRDVPATLAKHALTLGAYTRIDRRVATLLSHAAEAHARFEVALAVARAAHPAVDDDSDEEGEGSAK